MPRSTIGALAVDFVDNGLSLFCCKYAIGVVEKELSVGEHSLWSCVCLYGGVGGEELRYMHQKRGISEMCGVVADNRQFCAAVVFLH